MGASESSHIARSDCEAIVTYLKAFELRKRVGRCCFIICRMNRVHDIYQAIERPLLSFAAVLLGCIVFLIALYAIIVVVRLIAGLS